jgi:glycosyltransferase involved in cell wall biosynthesis
MSTVSAVVLTYNKAWIFQRFLAGLLGQTRLPDEVILVDDASEDEMPRLLRTVPKDWEVVMLPTNTGQSAARNLGFERTRGDYMIFLDADIQMQPDMLEVMEGMLDRYPEASLAYGHYLREGSRRDSVYARDWDAQYLRRGNYISTMAMVRRSDLPVPPFDLDLRRYEDWDLWLRMSMAGRKGVLVDRILFTAYYRPEDISGRGECTASYHRVRAKHGLTNK